MDENLQIERDKEIQRDKEIEGDIDERPVLLEVSV